MFIEFITDNYLGQIYWAEYEPNRFLKIRVAISLIISDLVTTTVFLGVYVTAF